MFGIGFLTKNLFDSQNIDAWSYSFWWLFWATLQTIVVHRFSNQWNIAFLDSVCTNGVLLLASIVTQNTYRFYLGGNKSRIFRFAWSIILSIATVYLIQFIITEILSDEVEYLKFLSLSMPIRFAYVMLMIAFTTVVSWLVYYVRHETENNKRKNEAEKALREAELSRLYLKLQPHFLFNSLNSISALAGSKPIEARKMIQQLSDFFRATLKKETTQFASLESELAHLQLYLEIEKVRFGERLHTIIHCNEDATKQMLPLLLLQPIVENAIKFGLYDVIGEVEISISAVAKKSELHLEIKNPFDPNTSKSIVGEGFGLSSIQRRLYLLFGVNNLLTTSVSNDIFTTFVIIPQTENVIEK